MHLRGSTTTLTDTLSTQDPVAQALWQAQRERTLASLKRIRAGFSDEEITTLAGLLSRLAANVAAGGIDQENSDWTHPNGDSGQD